MELEYTLQWSDARLFEHPCYGALNGMLSLRREAGRSDNARYAKQQMLDQFWIVKLGADGLAPAFDVLDEEAVVTLDPSTNWTAGKSPARIMAAQHLDENMATDAHATCENCVTRVAELELELTQRNFDFYYYPFDTQTIVAKLMVEGAHIYTCDNSTALLPLLPFTSLQDMADKLLPFTNEWEIARELHNSVQVSHPVEDGEVQYDQCEVRIVVQRRFVVYLVKYAHAKPLQPRTSAGLL